MTLTRLEEMTDQPTAEVVRSPLMSGHCSTHWTQTTLTERGLASHERCNRNGAGNRANPWHEFQPCPCPHHYLGPDGEKPEEYECSECGKAIIEAVDWPKDADGDPRYTHIDGDGRALGEECYGVAPKKEPVVSVSRNPEPEPEPVVYAPAVAEFEDDLSDLDDEDDFSDLDDL